MNVRRYRSIRIFIFRIINWSNLKITHSIYKLLIEVNSILGLGLERSFLFLYFNTCFFFLIVKKASKFLRGIIRLIILSNVYIFHRINNAFKVCKIRFLRYLSTAQNKLINYTCLNALFSRGPKYKRKMLFILTWIDGHCVIR